jgi:mxaA protein
MKRAGWKVRTLGAAMLALALAVAAAADKPADPDAIAVRVEEPRAFGHQVGDVLTRRIVIDVPRRLKLDESSLPVPGRVGHSFELRAVEHSQRPAWKGRRHVLLLRYQVFRAVEQPRVLDLPAFVLRFKGEPRAEEWRIDYAPVGAVPIAPTEPVLRQGLGALRPDVPPIFIDTRGERLRLAAYAMVAAGLLVYLSYAVWGWGWWQRRQRPFSQALRRVQALRGQGGDGAVREAWRVAHAALDASAGRVMDTDGIERFLALAPAYAPLADELRWFFGRSQAVFFAGAASGREDIERLATLCRRGRSIERGLA